MTVAQQRANAKARKAFSDLHGTDPIETGTVGFLADHECEHGHLPADPKPVCECFPKRRKRAKR